MGYHSLHVTHAPIKDALREHFTMEEIRALILGTVKVASHKRRGLEVKGNRIRVYAPGFIVTLYKSAARNERAPREESGGPSHHMSRTGGPYPKG